MELKQVSRKLNQLAPTSLAGSWDNVGLLVEPSAPHQVKSIFLTNDLTLPVMHEAIEKKVDLILSYHPPIFRPLKRLTQSAWKEAIVVQCIENRIAVYSPHTSFDAVVGGVNDWLISPFFKASFRKLSLNCTEKALPLVITLLSTQEGVTDTIEIMQLTKPPIPEHGPGRIGKLDSPMTIAEAVQLVKSHLKLKNVRLAMAVGGSLDSIVKSIAVCAGSGSSVLRGVKTDLHLTGEMSHHEVLDATHAGTSVILCDHSNTERGYLSEKLKPQLLNIFEQKIEVIVSEKDEDPLLIV
ncbi:hypothetical protein CAPTEDRAFT_2492 [Capitella teleta]|uniref:NIF3-like protein 1 n=1 Tax=Capitella teleta TaxID=283909 RepID=R7TFY0_CAPTE|nr:hypothetical protein CAPTEDRAFT_2492 [Capitella teleta]|eukprot:ELT92382.1 hypothetical protein CAPTEDRAFT_2492 [Capitella teleta]